MKEPGQVTVVLPTLDAGCELEEVLVRIGEQSLPEPPRIVAVDSGSRDGTVERLERHGAEVIAIDRKDFNHGTTRNLGLAAARTPFVAFLSQDALPVDEDWLPALLRPFSDPFVVGTYSRQLPRPECNPLVGARLAGWVASAEESRVQRFDPGELVELEPIVRLRRAAFDNVSSCVRREIALAVPFRACPLAEDLDWGLRVLGLGHEIVFAADSRVLHSHERSLWYELRRSYLDRQALYRLVGMRTGGVMGAVVAGARSGWAASEDWARARVGGAQVSGLLARWSMSWQCLVLGMVTALGQVLGYRSAVALERGSRKWYFIDQCIARRV